MKCFNFAPSNLHTRGFTLIELMIVVAIIATLLSLAIPAYRDYTIRARVGEGVTVAASAKAAVSETCQTNPGVVPTNSSTGWSFSSSTYVTSVVISNTCAQPWIIVRTRNTGAGSRRGIVTGMDTSIGARAESTGIATGSGAETNISQTVAGTGTNSKELAGWSCATG